MTIVALFSPFSLRRIDVNKLLIYCRSGVIYSHAKCGEDRVFFGRLNAKRAVLLTGKRGRKSGCELSQACCRTSACRRRAVS